MNSASCSRASDSKVSKLYTAILISQDIRALYITMDDTLVVQVYEPFQDLTDVDRYQVLWKFTEAFADIMQ